MDIRKYGNAKETGDGRCAALNESCWVPLWPLALSLWPLPPGPLPYILVPPLQPLGPPLMPPFYVFLGAWLAA